MKEEAVARRNTQTPEATGSVREGILVLNYGLEAIALDGGAEAILHDLDRQGGNGNGSLHGNGNGAHSVPEAVRDLLRGRAKNELNSVRARLKVEDREYSCRSFLMLPQNGFSEEPLIAVHLKRVSSLKEAVAPVAAEYHLTEREQEVLIGVSMGLTSKELAVRLNISPNTVNSFLRLIMIKMGMTTRSGIVGKLLK